MEQNRNVIQGEISEMLQRMETLTEDVRVLACDRRLPEYSRLMEIRATNRDILEISLKIQKINKHLLKTYNLEPLESIEKL